MKFCDYICDKIYEMAFRQAHSLEKIEELVPETIVHILKCRLMPDSRDLKHWLKEIKKWTDKMNVFSNTKTKSGRLSYENLLLQCKVEINPDTIIKEIPGLEWEYEVTFEEKDVLTAINFTTEFMKEIFYDLSQNNYDWLKYCRKIEIEGRL